MSVGAWVRACVRVQVWVECCISQPPMTDTLVSVSRLGTEVCPVCELSALKISAHDSQTHTLLSLYSLELGTPRLVWSLPGSGQPVPCSRSRERGPAIWISSVSSGNTMCCSRCYSLCYSFTPSVYLGPSSTLSSTHFGLTLFSGQALLCQHW